MKKPLTHEEWTLKQIDRLLSILSADKASMHHCEGMLSRCGHTGYEDAERFIKEIEFFRSSWEDAFKDLVIVAGNRAIGLWVSHSLVANPE